MTQEFDSALVTALCTGPHLVIVFPRHMGNEVMSRAEGFVMGARSLSVSDVVVDLSQVLIMDISEFESLKLLLNLAVTQGFRPAIAGLRPEVSCYLARCGADASPYPAYLDFAAYLAWSQRR